MINIMISASIRRWLFLVVLLPTCITITSSKEMRVVCYYTNWSVYRPGAAKFSPQNINPYLCTHLVYAFGGFTKDNTLKPFDKYQDIEKGGYAKFTGLKTYNKNLKTLIAIGGWNEGSSRFSSMVANPDRRKELVKNVIKFLRLNHFDGLDLDWEYPAFRDGGKPRDKDNYANLVQELREEFEREFEKTGRPRLLLTMAVPAGIEYINKGFDVPKLTRYLDWMNILSYDYHSAFEPAVNHHAPLFSLEEDNEYNFDADLNIDHTIRHYLKLGAQPDKLVVGIPTYGRSYTLFNPDAFEIGSPADGPGTMGEATRENGYLAYYEICDYVKNQGWEVEQPNPDSMGPIAFKDDQWVGYDDEGIVRKKAEYVAENGLGGIMFWAIDNDDFRGTCHGKPYPLIEAGREALLNAYGITEDNSIVPSSKPTKTRSRTKSKLSRGKSQSENVEKTSAGGRRRNRVNSDANERPIDDSRRRKIRLKNTQEREETSSYSSLKVVTPRYTTPAPPSTPDLDGAFKCEDEGFFPHPKDCKKYFWCLSGAGDSGIVAHQFTCPAGLYFNKAADSCDYTQNVLCNKKLQKSSKSTTKDAVSTVSTTSAPTTSSTPRVPPKITAATTRTTFRQTTTTEAYDEDDYDYEEDDGEDKTKSKEEDPEVIKELIDLIKKAGGIEELEKQLRHPKNPSAPTSQFTTQSPIRESLERVLSKTLKKSPTSGKSTYTSLRNSRGPQNEGLRSGDENISTRSERTRGKLSYTSISRNRATTGKPTDDEDEEDGIDSNDQMKKDFPEKSIPYVNIRRSRISSTTSEPENEKEFDRNQILGEESDTEGGNRDIIDVRKNTYDRQYVNIRRPRPSSTEEPETVKYVQLRRGTTEATDEGTTSKYKVIRRGTTTTSYQGLTEANFFTRKETTTSASPSISVDYVSAEKEINFSRGSTTQKAADDVDDTKSDDDKSFKSDDSTVSSIKPDDSTVSTSSSNDILGSTSAPNGETTLSNSLEIRTSYGNNMSTFQENSSTPADNINRTLVSEVNLDTDSTPSQVISPKHNTTATQLVRRPQVSQTRPILKSTRGTTTSKSIIETTPKVSQSNLKYRPETDSQLKESLPSQQYKTRGFLRFHGDGTGQTENKNSGSFPQRVRVSTTEKYIEEKRSYRPSQLADLSSLTAVDFSKLKELDFGRATGRRGRPVKTTTTEEPSDVIETNSSSTSTTRKSTPSFERGRKFFRKNINRTHSDSAVTQTTKRVRGFGLRSTTEPSTSESASITKSFNPSSRNRKIIRRLKANITTPKPTQKNEDDYDADVLVKPKNDFLLNEEPIFQQNKVEDENDDDDPISEEEENIKLSESNIRENSAINTFDPDTKSRNKLLGTGKSYFPEKSMMNKQYSTSPYIIRGSTDKNELSNLPESTEPSIVVRTRKVIRKLYPTETTTTRNNFESEPTYGRKRKIIRRLRPISKFNRIEQNEERHQSNLEETDTATEMIIAGNILENSGKPLSVDPIDDAVETTERITDNLLSSTEKEDVTESLLEHEPTNDSKLRTAKVTIVPKRLFRPELFNSKKEHSKSNSTDGEIHDSKIIRISPTTHSNGTKRIANRGRNRIFRPKIIESSNEFKNSNADKSFSSTPKYNLYSRRLNFKKFADSEISHLTDTDALNTEDNESTSTEPEFLISTKHDELNVNELETVTPTEVQTSTNNLMSLQSFEDLEKSDDNNEDKPNADTEDIRILDGVQDDHKINHTLNEYFLPEIISSGYNRSKRPKNKYSSLTTEGALTTLQDPHGSTTILSTYISENAEESFIGEFVMEDLNSESMNTSIYGVNNTTESSTAESITIMNDSEINIVSELYTGPEEDKNTNGEFSKLTEESTDMNEEIEELSTPTISYDITTPVNIVTKNIDNIDDVILKDETNYSSSSNSPYGDQESTEMSDTTARPSSETVTEVTNVSSAPNLDASTKHYRPYTLRPLSSRPKYLPPRLRELSLGYSAESKLKTIERNRFDPTTENDLYIEEPKFDKSVTEENTNLVRPELPFRLGVTQRNRFNKFKKGYTRAPTTTESISNPDDHVESSSVTTINRFLYKYSTMKQYDVKFGDDDEEPPEDIDEQGNGNVGNEEDKVSEISSDSIKNKSNTPTFPRKPITRLSNKPFFSKPRTENPRVDEALKNVDTTAIKNRNKTLFAKNRTLSAPSSVQYSSTNSVADRIGETTIEYLSTEILTTESTIPTDPSQTTEDATTTHQVQPELSEDSGTTTEVSSDKIETTANKVERLIEVNRITKVETKEEHLKNHIIELKRDEASPIQDKVGEVNRVTVIKVVDTDDQLKNETVPVSPIHGHVNLSTTESAIKSSVDMIIEIAKVQEIPANEILGKVNFTNISVSLNTSNIPISSDREGRKIEIFGVGGSKFTNNRNFNRVEGFSKINIVTPRPAHNPESSTIPLEGLFQTEGATLYSKYPTINDELLETEHSKFVNVRVLHPNNSLGINKASQEMSNVIPIKILNQDEKEYFMKADVVEIPPKENSNTIIISPIEVKMSKSISNNLPLIRLSNKNLPPA